MSFKILLAEGAIEDMEKAIAWYEKKVNGLGNYFAKSINSSFELLKINPTIFQIQFDEFRQVPIKHFPFVIIYEIIEDGVLIHAIFHTSRNPNEKFIKRK